MMESKDTWKQDTGEAEAGKPAKAAAGMSESGFWQKRPDGNPYWGSDGICRFQELYTGKRRKDRTAWSDYFLSWTFLKGWREEAFTRLMWETVRDHQEDCPPGREFLTELYIAYGIRKISGEFRAEDNALFPGLEYIAEIAKLGPVINQFKKNDPAMQMGFRDYRELLMMARTDSWDDGMYLYLGKIVDRYTLANISDRPILNAQQYELSQRHPRSVRLITCFFQHADLPEQAYRILWNHLYLDNATNGREKLLYGELREAALIHLPELGEKPRVSYRELLREFNQYDTGSSYFFNEGRTEEERESMDQFFAKDDVQYALADSSFVEEQILHYWITRGSGAYLLEKLKIYYETHPQAPYAGRVLARIQEVQEERQEKERVQQELMEDEQSGYTWGRFDFQRRAYVRYYLNTAFHLARGLKDQICLTEHLAGCMPYSPEWSRGLAEPEKSGLSAGQPVEIRFGKNVLHISFHMRYLEYRWNDSPRVPYFPGEDLEKIEDDTQFWLLAPIAVAPFATHLSLFAELKKRLSRLPVPKEDIPVIADCITGRICREEDEELPVLSLYAEKGDQLFGCDICRNDTLVLYEETLCERNPVPNGIYRVGDMDMAVRMGTRLLDELTRQKDAGVYLKQLPVTVLVRIPYQPEKVYREEQVTEALVQELLREYLDEKINRLELVFGGHSLLFLGDGKRHQYACFCFLHGKQDWYALVSLPEVYATVESDAVVHVPFGLGRLCDYQVHQNTNMIRELLDEILSQTACSDPDPRMMMWSPQIYRFETRQRYRLAKRLYGGYPAAQACNQILDRFYLPHLPVRISYTESDGTSSGPVEVKKDKAGVQYQLSRYMQGALGRLTLTWRYEEGYTDQKRHLILIQDEGRHQLIYMDDGPGQIHRLVADVKEYMDAEGNRYRKEIFLGQTVPGYLIHEDLRRIRDCLDLLFSEIMDPSAILDQFGEFSYDGKSNYEKMREQYLQVTD